MLLESRLFIGSCLILSKLLFDLNNVCYSPNQCSEKICEGEREREKGWFNIQMLFLLVRLEIVFAHDKCCQHGIAR